MKRGLPESSYENRTKFIAGDTERKSSEDHLFGHNCDLPAVETNMAENILSSAVGVTNNLTSGVNIATSLSISEDNNTICSEHSGVNVPTNYVSSEVRVSAYKDCRTSIIFLTGALIRHLIVKKHAQSSNIPSFCEKYNVYISPDNEQLFAFIVKVVVGLNDSIESLFEATKDKLSSSRNIGFFVERVAINLLEDDSRHTEFTHFMEHFILFLTITCQIAAMIAHTGYPALLDQFVDKISDAIQSYQSVIKKHGRLETIFNYCRDVADFHESACTSIVMYFGNIVNACIAALKTEMASF